LILSGVSYIIVGKITDVYNNKEKVMVVGYLLNALFTFSYLLVSSPWHLFIVQAGLGIAAALATPTWDALYSKHEDRKNGGFQWGIADGMAQIVPGLGLIVGGYMIVFGSFVTLFITMGIIQVIAAIYQAQILIKK